MTTSSIHFKKPNTDGFLVVEWEDSSLEEVMASSFVINRIFEE